MRLSFFAAMLILAAACNGKTDQPPQLPPQPRYSFYPKANVYFDTVNKNYVFLGSDGRTWTTGKEIPAAMQAMMDKSVLLDTFPEPVWKDNENHRLVYAAALYASPEDTVVEKKAAPVVPASPKADNEDQPVKKERKGLRKFIDKIFGRKKDKGEN